MKKIINYLRIKKWRTLQIIILLFIVSLLQVGTSYIQVSLDYIAVIKLFNKNEERKISYKSFAYNAREI